MAQLGSGHPLKEKTGVKGGRHKTDGCVLRKEATEVHSLGLLPQTFI